MQKSFNQLQTSASTIGRYYNDLHFDFQDGEYPSGLPVMIEELEKLQKSKKPTLIPHRVVFDELIKVVEECQNSILKPGEPINQTEGINVIEAVRGVYLKIAKRFNAIDSKLYWTPAILEQLEEV